MTGEEFRALALSLAGTTCRPHFDRTAFRVRRNFATLAAGGTEANLLLATEEQAHFAALSDFVRPVANKWGDRGWTTVDLGTAPGDLIGVILRAAWRNGGGADG